MSTNAAELGWVIPALWAVQLLSNRDRVRGTDLIELLSLLIGWPLSSRAVHRVLQQ